jgi:hypothetical protein
MTLELRAAVSVLAIEPSRQVEDFGPMKSAAMRGMERALDRIIERFEMSEPRSRLPYHNHHHTGSVVLRTLEILAISREFDPGSVTGREVALGIITASFHDTVQEWREKKLSDGTVLRIRPPELKNEERSADEAIAFMESENIATGAVLFTDLDKRCVRSAIMGTVPQFVSGTVIQPNVGAGSDILTRAVALADLGGAGMLDYTNSERGWTLDRQTSFENAAALFREHNLDIFDAVLAHGARPISPEKQTIYRTRMLKALRDETAFIDGREGRLSAEISGFPPAVRENLRKRFAYFDLSRSVIDAAVTEMEAEPDFFEVARRFGYDI